MKTHTLPHFVNNGKYNFCRLENDAHLSVFVQSFNLQSLHIII